MRSNGVLRAAFIMAKASGDSGAGVPANIFRRIQDSFTTQGFRQTPRAMPAGLHRRVIRPCRRVETLPARGR
jgi:hypothetical protein